MRPDGKPISLKFWNSEPTASYRESPASDLQLAITELASFERKFDRDESKLKQLVANYIESQGLEDK